MARRFKYPGRLWLTVFWIFLQAAGSVDADLIGGLCDANTDPAMVIEALVEEAEATGMPPATLNRLLAVGYRDPEAAVDLKSLLCTIITMEERGLPPEPLFEKLEEGLGKKVPLKNIQTVITHQAEKLQYAQTLLSGKKEPLMDDVNVERIAALLDIGVSRDELDTLFGPAYSSPTAMRIVAAEILGYGTIAGFPQLELNQVVSAGLTSRSLTPEWSFFIMVIKEARKQGIADERISAAATKILSKNKPMDDLIAQLGLEGKHVYDGRHRN